MFQITFVEIIRLYGDYASNEELKKCLDELEKEGMLRRRKNISDAFLFVNEIKGRLSDLTIENLKVIEKKDSRKKELEIIGRLQELWLDQIQLNPASNFQTEVLRYFISVYWQSKINLIKQKLSEVEERREKIENEVYELKKVLEEP